MGLGGGNTHAPGELGAVSPDVLQMTQSIAVGLRIQHYTINGANAVHPRHIDLIVTISAAGA